MLADIYLRSNDCDTFLGCAEITEKLRPGEMITALGITGEVIEKTEILISGEQKVILCQVYVR